MIAATPPMGWNSWNAFRTAIDEEQLVAMADAMVASGLRDAGYRYFVVDDGWQARERSSDGTLQAHPERFSHGIAWLAEQVHDRGLQFGLYASPGRQTCAMIYDAYDGVGLGSFGHEQHDADTFASWGVDFLKYDWCEANRGSTGLDYPEAFARMRRALDATGREIVYSISEYGRSNPWEWAPALANMWRTTPDIEKSPDSVYLIATAQRGLEQYAGPGHWNDPDMLQVGNPGLSMPECRSHLGLWALLAAPLMAGNDLRTMPDEIAALLTTPGVIAIDQDALGRQGRRIRHEEACDVWVRELSDDRVAVGVMNLTTEPITAAWDDGLVVVQGRDEHRLAVPLAGEVTDAWTGAASSTSTIEPHDLALVVAARA